MNRSLALPRELVATEYPPLARRALLSIVLLISSAFPLAAQSPLPKTMSDGLPDPTPDTLISPAVPVSQGGTQDQNQFAIEPLLPVEPIESGGDPGGEQTKRTVSLVPNFQAVSADILLPPLSFEQKFRLATEGSFDYSSFVFVGLQAGFQQTTKTYPEFHQDATGYGRYYWHAFADQAAGNYFTGAILPAITHEDPRYYTLYHGGFFHRMGYAVSRLVITKDDSGAATFNYSEIVGNGLAAGVSGFYYPRQIRGDVGQTFTRWASQILSDAIGNLFDEFWPDINRKVLHRK